MEASEPRRRRAAIVCVDDEPAVLAAVARDLRRRFGEHYRIVRAGSGPGALETGRELRRRGEQGALLVAHQRQPGLAGGPEPPRGRQSPPAGQSGPLPPPPPT